MLPSGQINVLGGDIDQTPWSVTVASCGARIGRALTEEGARKLAGAFGGFPIKWNKIPPFTSIHDHDRVVKVIQSRVPAELFAWTDTVCRVGVA